MLSLIFFFFWHKMPHVIYLHELEVYISLHSIYFWSEAFNYLLAEPFCLSPYNVFG